MTKDEADRAMWRIPTWRNVALIAPYFHNGSVAPLDEAVVLPPTADRTLTTN